MELDTPSQNRPPGAPAPAPVGASVRSLLLPGLGVVALAALALTCWHFASRWEAKTGPIEITLTKSLDVGSVDQGSAASPVLTLENPTLATLHIDSVATSCECLSVTNYPKEIGPKQSGGINLSLAGIQTGDFEFIVNVRAHKDDLKQQDLYTAHIVASVVSPTLLKTKATARHDGLLLAPTDLVSKGGAVTFVDVRSAKDFAWAFIPGSLNLPLAAIKTRPELQADKFVIVDDGIADAPLLEAAQSLRKQGFSHAAVLEGGIRAWKLAGGRLESRGSATFQAALVSAWRLPQVAQESDWDFVRIDAPAGIDTQETPIKRWSASWNYHGNKAELVAQAARFLAPAERKLLIVAPSDEIYRAVEDSLPPNLARSVFYLHDGFQALQQFSRAQVALQGPLLKVNNYHTQAVASGRVAGGRLGGCATCPGKH